MGIVYIEFKSIYESETYKMFYATWDAVKKVPITEKPITYNQLMNILKEAAKKDLQALAKHLTRDKLTRHEIDLKLCLTSFSKELDQGVHYHIVDKKQL